MSKFLPSKILTLLAASCVVWIGILTLAFMSFTGTDVTAGWICAGALFFALVVWIAVMASEFRSAEMAESIACPGEDDFGVTGTLPRLKGAGSGSSIRGRLTGRRILPVSSRPISRRLSRAERPAG